ncbi:Flap endonuclease GEN 1 [Elsinoe australis]|uniref:Flap endonuclease GEN 1 n=1 Tax=Elsinoe australis TaxID=40998 RepID=A0A2P8A932_9PEZI|nr:Flap endonuclease GEN 1 [Elsinoe australis]
MGVTGLWGFLGDGRVESLARLSSEHYRRSGRPFKIAIDEACWRFNNVNAVQVAQWRKSEPRANPIEKQILYWIVRLLRLNFELVFVFDGPGRPAKRGGHGGVKPDYDRVRLLKGLLDHLRILYIEAPAEAEAECARLQKMGIVDAVWSDDGDTLVFGATRLIRFHRPAGNKYGKKSTEEVEVVDLTEISMRRGTDLRYTHLILFALLTGGDYDGQGLKSCGPAIAKDVLSTNKGRNAAEALINLSLPHGLGRWRTQVAEAMHEQRHLLSIPSDWPKARVVSHYVSPKTSSDIELLKHRSLQSQLRCIDVPKLSMFPLRYFNFQLKDYKKHIVPVLLVEQLRTSLAITVVHQHKVEIKKKRQWKDKGPSFLRTIKYDAHPISGQSLIPTFLTNNQTDTEEVMETEVLDILLQQAMGSSYTPDVPAGRTAHQAAVEAERKRAAEQRAADYEALLSKDKRHAHAEAQRQMGAESASTTRSLGDEKNKLPGGTQKSKCAVDHKVPERRATTETRGIVNSKAMGPTSIQVGRADTAVTNKVAGTSTSRTNGSLDPGSKTVMSAASAIPANSAKVICELDKLPCQLAMPLRRINDEVAADPVMANSTKRPGFRLPISQFTPSKRALEAPSAADHSLKKAKVVREVIVID